MPTPTRAKVRAALLALSKRVGPACCAARGRKAHATRLVSHSNG